MTLPPPATLLRHRPPALHLDAVEDASAERIACASRGAGPWRWPALLEGAAQAAGLLAGLQGGEHDATALVAEYRDVVVHAPEHAGPVRFVARLERRLLGCWRCAVVVEAEGGALLLEGRVTIAPGRARRP
jgi:hypothetical protein